MTPIVPTALIRSVVRAALTGGVVLEQIVLFGSRAKGNHRPDSDYDLVLIVPETLTMRERAQLQLKVYTALGADWNVDLLTASAKEMQVESYSWGLNAARRDGKVIYTKAGIEHAA